LNPRQQKFVELYLGGMPASRAYRQAGYRPSTDAVAEAAASQLLKHPKVAAAVEAARAKATEAAGVSAEVIAQRLWVEANRQPADGGTHAGRIRALELLGKGLGMFQDRVQIETADADPLARFRYLTDEELDHLIALHDQVDQRMAAGEPPARP
jgi:hypothetical protein